eukprot:gnl/TRDRNA2_/TRDRNA2_176505_c3_seq1.p1 gnl/TRDRNA2_/TRDRNA2_176505_c3~~gnl/TRDRNA2_/TRDRNA2_176505_c3_seq1.p1  ORF type:complete len:313 (+),score=20.53 gnl/TRDRNA2_/TRDRNA2_176505_c3_seq1:83-940(+)
MTGAPDDLDKLQELAKAHMKAKANDIADSAASTISISDAIWDGLRGRLKRQLPMITFGPFALIFVVGIVMIVAVAAVPFPDYRDFDYDGIKTALRWHESGQYKDVIMGYLSTPLCAFGAFTGCIHACWYYRRWPAREKELVAIQDLHAKIVRATEIVAPVSTNQPALTGGWDSAEDPASGKVQWEVPTGAAPPSPPPPPPTVDDKLVVLPPYWEKATRILCHHFNFHRWPPCASTWMCTARVGMMPSICCLCGFFLSLGPGRFRFTELNISVSHTTWSVHSWHNF